MNKRLQILLMMVMVVSSVSFAMGPYIDDRPFEQIIKEEMATCKSASKLVQQLFSEYITAIKNRIDTKEIVFRLQESKDIFEGLCRHFNTLDPENIKIDMSLVFEKGICVFLKRYMQFDGSYTDWIVVR